MNCILLSPLVPNPCALPRFLFILNHFLPVPLEKMSIFGKDFLTEERKKTQQIPMNSMK